jgi:hypothetical protein
MRVVITQLTRMDAPRICVAGIEPATGRHVRPTTGRLHPLTRTLLVEQGGPLRLGALIELGEVNPNPDPPETEDHLFRPNRAQPLGQLTPNRYFELLRANAHRSLQAIFGKELQRNGRSYAVEKGHGSASLGILQSQRKTDIVLDRYDKLRLRLPTSAGAAYLPVTDVRFVDADHTTIKAEIVEDVRARMKRGVETFLMLGLSRAFAKTEDDRERHWLQVNGICLTDQPLAAKP